MINKLVWKLKRTFWFIFGRYYSFYIINFRRIKLKQSLANRKIKKGRSTCNGCGLCCKGCVLHNSEKGICNRWENVDYRCKAYPLFSWQINYNPELKEKCRYYWENKK